MVFPLKVGTTYLPIFFWGEGGNMSNLWVQAFLHRGLFFFFFFFLVFNLLTSG